MLSVLNDGPVHELFLPMVEDGATVIHALWSRAWVDLNRDATELDDQAIAGVPERYAARRSLRVRAGLGVVPTRLGERRIHQRRPIYREIAARISEVHAPYHAVIDAECAFLARMFGRVILLDCHSMPGEATGPNGVPDIALGDRFGRSCGPELLAAVEQVFSDAGFVVARNRPFAGGWITERHGRPERGMNALQIELRRDLFLQADGRLRLEGQLRLQAVARKLAQRLRCELAGPHELALQAAE